MTDFNTPQHIKLDERNHVEKPLLDQLKGLGWKIIDLDSKQHPGDSYRQSFTEVVMLPVLRAQLKKINDWLEDDQVEEVIKQLTASFPSTGLIQNNKHVFTLLLENTTSAKTARPARKARLFVLSTSPTGITTALLLSASSKFASSAQNTTSSRTSSCS